MNIFNCTLGHIIGGSTGIFVLLSVFIEIIPIKINPISTFLRWLGTKINVNLLDKFDALDKRVNRLENEIARNREEAQESRAVMARIRILTFADEIRLGQLHSKEAYDQVLEDIDYYEKYCDGHPRFKNNKTIYSKQKILETYSDRLDKNDFL